MESNVDIQKVKEARDKLREYLNEFPEHDQGDHRVFTACEILSKELLRHVPDKD